MSLYKSKNPFDGRVNHMVFYKYLFTGSPDEREGLYFSRKCLLIVKSLLLVFAIARNVNFSNSLTSNIHIILYLQWRRHDI